MYIINITQAYLCKFQTPRAEIQQAGCSVVIVTIQMMMEHAVHSSLQQALDQKANTKGFLQQEHPVGLCPDS